MKPSLADDALLAELRACVTRARPTLDTGQGVKMLYSDSRSLSNRVWTVGLDPGGSHEEPDQWCREEGAHDYRDGYRLPGTAELRAGGLELRIQLGEMMRWLGLDWRETLSLNLVPFRCAGWDDMPLPWKKAAIALAGGTFWPLLLAHRRPRLVVSFGSDAAKVLRRLVGHRETRTYPVDWGKVTADVTHGNGVTVLRLPHLSRYGIFVRPSGTGRAALSTLRSDPWLAEAVSSAIR